MPDSNSKGKEGLTLPTLHFKKKHKAKFSLKKVII